MLCSHFVIDCVYNGINEGKQFSLWLSLALCFCGVLCIVQAIDINFLFFVGSYFVAPYAFFEWVPCVGSFLGGNVATENDLHIWCRWSISQCWGYCNIHTAFLTISHNDIPHASQNGLTTYNNSGLRLHSTSWSFVFSLQQKFILLVWQFVAIGIML